MKATKGSVRVFSLATSRKATVPVPQSPRNSTFSRRQAASSSIRISFSGFGESPLNQSYPKELQRQH